MSKGTNTYSNLSDQTKFRLNEINKIEKYFNVEIQEQNIMSKKLSIYIATFDYFDNTLIGLFATRGGVSIISSAGIIGSPVRIVNASFSLIFTLTTEMITKILKITKYKHNKVVMLASSKLNSIETLISPAIVGLEISHENYKSVINEEENYKRLKENISNMGSDDELNEQEEK